MPFCGSNRMCNYGRGCVIVVGVLENCWCLVVQELGRLRKAESSGELDS